MPVMRTLFGWIPRWWWRRARQEADAQAAPRDDGAQRGQADGLALRSEAVPLATKGAADLAEGEQSFLETVGSAAGVQSSVATTALDPVPVLRRRTLAALADLKQIPALQSLARAFTLTAGRVDVDVADIVTSIEKDSALCVRVLGMANSVGVGSERRVEDLATAVQLLGVARVRRLAQALFTLRDSQRMTEGLDWRHLWVHAFATAAIAEELERNLHPDRARTADEAESPVYLAGLLHDVGKIVLSTVAPEAYREILVAAWRGDGRLEALEQARLGVTHREAGAIFAEHQRLPEIVVAAIGQHATPEAAEKFRFEVAVVALANFLSKAHGLGFSGARLEESDGDFAEQPAWRVIGAERGGEVTELEKETIEEELARFVVGLREELKALRQGA